MSPEEYRRGGELFEQLRHLPEEARDAALAAACGDNTELRGLVARLLEADRGASDHAFLEGRAIEDAALLLGPQDQGEPASGTILGNYRLGRRIAAGGMAVVYEGEDLRLHRRVAIKIPPLPAAPERKERIQRFQREARAASQLNHPNIVSIYDADFDEGYYYIALEFVEGRTLRELIAEPPLPEPKTLLDLIGQAASALSAAHGAGIVHRDIKPDNIMVRPDGFVKVLDFGLAKLREPPSNPGVSVLLTRPGNLAGTIQYLSPEQVAGRPAGPTSDLFSLGVVAYELATGVRPFDGPTDGAIFDAILNRNPAPPSSIRPGLGDEIDRLILQALEKDPDFRFQTAGDLVSACKRLSRDPSGSGPAPLRSAQRRPRVSLRTGVAAASALAALTALGGYYAGSRREIRAPMPVSFSQLTANPGEESVPSLSADGSQFVYASAREGNWDIFLQRTGGSTPINLTKDCAQDDTQPALSPDGAGIVFRSERDGGGLFVMELTGENPRRIAQQGYLPAWAPDGRSIVYSSQNFTIPSARDAPVGRLSIAGLSGGTVRQLDTGDAIQPRWSPHGYRIAYWGLPAGGRRDIFTAPASGTGPPVAVTSDNPIDWYPVWSATGEHLYFLSDRGGTMNVWRVPIDERSGRTLGPPEPVIVPAPYVASLDLSRDGRFLLYGHASRRNLLRRIGFDAARRIVSGLPEPAGGDHTVSNFSFARDGSKLVYDTFSETSEDLWVMNADGSGRRRILAGGYKNRAPGWSPAGDEIVFLSDRGGGYGNWLIRADGSGLRPLTADTFTHMQKAIWSPDATRLLASRSPGSPVLLNPRSPAPIADLTPAPGLEGEEGVYFTHWSTGVPGGIVLGDRITGPGAPEIILYHVAEARVEHTGISGRYGFWLPSKNGENPGRYFVFSRGGDCLLFDRALKRETRLFSIAPDRFYNLAVAPGGRHLYFSQTIFDADLWLARLGPTK